MSIPTEAVGSSTSSVSALAKRAWPLGALALCAFGIGVTEFAPMGLLPLIASDLAVTIPTAGLLVTGYAVGVMFGAPVVTLLTLQGLVALEESPKILHRDHENAKHLAVGLAQIKGIALDPRKVVTNILIFDVRATGRTADEICVDLGKRKVLCGSTDKFSVRMVTHYDVDRAAIDRALAAVAEVLHASTHQSHGAQGAA